jgi:hypothetical protein
MRRPGRGLLLSPGVLTGEAYACAHPNALIRAARLREHQTRLVARSAALDAWSSLTCGFAGHGERICALIQARALSVKLA